MEKKENLNINYSGKSIAKNSIYNLFGYGIPLVFAIAIIPPLIKGLGTERFGILSLAWIIIGYFSFFDFGIGRALTKIVAEKIGTNRTEEIPGLFWTSFFLMLFISLLFTIILIILAPSLVYNFFKISKSLQVETLNTLYILALSIPIVTTTAGIRGILEAYQKFGIINIIRIILGVFSFLGPLLCLIFTNSLFWIACFLIIVRIVVWILYMSHCLKLNINLKSKFYFESSLVKPILKLSGWMTVSNFVVPLIVYSDRFLIGALVSAKAIAYYATPYEAVTKLLVIPGALTGVLFPAFSASYLTNPDFTKKISLRAVKYIFILLYPIILLIITFANKGMSLWLGVKFAENSTLILQLLAIGVLFNCLAYIPFAFLQGIGRPDITAKVNLIELPIYLLFMWIAIKYDGINGAAFVWMLRMAIDAIVLFLFAKRHISTHFEFKLKYNYLIILFVCSIFPVLISVISLKLILLIVIQLAFLFVSWKFLLQEEERMFLVSRIKLFYS
jgi:O-antigen/teichoic acid export membrane protein